MCFIENQTIPTTMLKFKIMFFIVLQVIGDVKTRLHERDEKLSFYALTRQPVVILVGPSFKEIEVMYVVVNNIWYNFQLPLKAVDLCFKILFTSNLEYSKEGEHLRLFLQKGAYCIKTPNYKQIMSVNTLLLDLIGI